MVLKAETDDEHTNKESKLFQIDILWGTKQALVLAKGRLRTRLWLAWLVAEVLSVNMPSSK